MVSENRVLRGIFGLKREGVWWKLHNEKFGYFNSSPNIIHTRVGT